MGVLNIRHRECKHHLFVSGVFCESSFILLVMSSVTRNPHHHEFADVSAIVGDLNSSSDERDNSLTAGSFYSHSTSPATASAGKSS